MKIFLMPFLIIFIFLFSCNNTQETKNIPLENQKIQFRGEAQGTYYAITYFDTLGRNFQTQIDSLLLAYDLSVSGYNSASIVSKVNRNEEVELDSTFIGNFKLSQRVSEESEGAFDITVKPLVELWGFGLKHRSSVQKNQVLKLLPSIGYQKIRLENDHIIKLDTSVKIDFNAIAQGYSVDVVGRYLESNGITKYLIDIGGEVYGKSRKPDGNKWNVGIEQPKDNAEYGDNINAILEIENKALATSGSYRKFYKVNGVKYSHTIDPKTGYPVQHSLLSASIIANTTAEADAYATVMMVLGLEKSILFLEKHPELDAYLIYSNKDDNFQIYKTKGIDKYLKK